MKLCVSRTFVYSLGTWTNLKRTLFINDGCFSDIKGLSSWPPLEGPVKGQESEVKDGEGETVFHFSVDHFDWMSGRFLSKGPLTWIFYEVTSVVSTVVKRRIIRLSCNRRTRCRDSVEQFLQCPHWPFLSPVKSTTRFVFQCLHGRETSDLIPTF